MVTEETTTPSSSALAVSSSAAMGVETVVTTWKEEEEDKKGKVKKFPFSKQADVVLESENKFFLGRKEGDPKLLGEEVKWLFCGWTISFDGGRTKVGGLNLMMGGTFA